MFAPSPMQKTLTYDQQSCQLRVEGLPDLSAGHGPNDIGILTRWILRWAGRPELEGERHHLEALIAAVLPYARHLVSDVRRPFGASPVRLSPDPSGEGQHRLLLESGQPGAGSLEVSLDDAELADLVRVLDRLRHDPRVKLSWPAPPERPLRSRDLARRVPLRRRLAAPLGGVVALALATFLAALLPTPSRSPAARGPVPAAAPAANGPSSSGGRP